MGGYPGSNLPGMGGQPVYNPPVPYQGMISGGMFPKRTIIIRGFVPFGGSRMAINFVVSRSRDIAFHMNPRLNEGLVMSIRCGNQRFKVFVNGQHLFDFFHRMQSFNEIDRLEIDGDVQISYIHF
ncbi:hypothetical protein WMY93_029224 [Mugilogobius chulae]|uniref:Galectin n=1 Tax=Mugilogobius chulae TaxID=88201 RepID=A0AAW0MSE6_9GOBI